MPFHLQSVTMPFHFTCLGTLGNGWLCDLQPGRGSTPGLITKLVWNNLAWIVSLRSRISEYPEQYLCASQTAFLACLHLRELLCPAGVDVSWAALKLLPKQMHRSSPRAALPPSVSSLSLRKLQHKPVALALPLLKVAHFPTDLCTLTLEVPLPEFRSGHVSYSPGDLTWAGFTPAMLMLALAPTRQEGCQHACARHCDWRDVCWLGCVHEEFSPLPRRTRTSVSMSHVSSHRGGSCCQALCPIHGVGLVLQTAFWIQTVWATRGRYALVTQRWSACVADVCLSLAATASVSTVGPGIYYCLLNQPTQARATATATWAQNNGFVFWAWAWQWAADLGLLRPVNLHTPSLCWTYIGLWSCWSMPTWSFQSRHCMLMSTPALALVFRNWYFIRVAVRAELWPGKNSLNDWYEPYEHFEPWQCCQCKNALITCRHNCMAWEVVRVLGLQCNALPCWDPSSTRSQTVRAADAKSVLFWIHVRLI